MVSEEEWQFVKRSIPVDWYWFHNDHVARMEESGGWGAMRRFYFDLKTKMYPRAKTDPYWDKQEKCLVYVYPGNTATDKYCGGGWARALCEIRC